MKTKTGLPVLAFAATLLLGLAPATTTADSTTVTTNSYSSTSTSDDVDKSCKNLAMNSSGTLSGDCNASGSTTSSTLDMTSNIACGASAGTSTAIAWRTTQNSYFEVSDWSIVLNSTGTKYLVEAKCKSRYTTVVAAASTLELGHGTKGVENDSGSLSF